LFCVFVVAAVVLTPIEDLTAILDPVFFSIVRGSEKDINPVTKAN